MLFTREWVIVNFEIIGLEYSPIPASLNLKEAFAAAHLLHAKKLVPIHYGLFAHEKCYIPQLFDENDLERVSVEIGQDYKILEDGKVLIEV